MEREKQHTQTHTHALSASQGTRLAREVGQNSPVSTSASFDSLITLPASVVCVLHPPNAQMRRDRCNACTGGQMEWMSEAIETEGVRISERKKRKARTRRGTWSTATNSSRPACAAHVRMAVYWCVSLCVCVCVCGWPFVAAGMSQPPILWTYVYSSHTHTHWHTHACPPLQPCSVLSVSASAQSERRPFLTNDVVALSHTLTSPTINFHQSTRERKECVCVWGGGGGRQRGFLDFNVPSTRNGSHQAGTESERETDSDTERQTDRDRETDRQRETETETDRETETDPRETDWQTETETQRERERHWILTSFPQHRVIIVLEEGETVTGF